MLAKKAASENIFSKYDTNISYEGMMELTENIEEGELIFSLASITRFNFEDQKKMQSSSNAI